VKKTIGCVLLALGVSFGIFENMESGARADGMAGAFTAVADDASAIHFNPAGLNQIHRTNVYGFYELLFGGVDENLHNATLNAAVPLPGGWGTAGASIQEMGFVLNSERSLTLSHGFGLGKDLNVGYSLIGYNVAMKDLGQAFAFGVDVGFHAKLAKRWGIGFSAHNLNLPSIGRDVKTELPFLLNFGLAYMPVSGITSTFAVSKENGQATRLAVGQEFEIVQNLLTLRAGVQTEPVRFTFGLGTGTGNIHLDYALLTHSDLPLTHNVGLSVTF
jgi:hypothetical protein